MTLFNVFRARAQKKAMLRALEESRPITAIRTSPTSWRIVYMDEEAEYRRAIDNGVKAAK